MTTDNTLDQDTDMVEESTETDGEERHEEPVSTQTTQQRKVEPKKEDTETEIAFTPAQQAYINELIGKARKEGRAGGEKAIQSKLKEIGVNDIEDIKALREAEKQRRQAEMSEIERLQAELEEQRSDKTNLKSLVEQKEAQLRKTLIRNEINLAARDHKFRNTDDLHAFISIDDLEIDLETGSVEGLDKQVKALIKNRPYLIEVEPEPQPEPVQEKPRADVPATPRRPTPNPTAEKDERRRKAFKLTSL